MNAELNNDTNNNNTVEQAQIQNGVGQSEAIASVPSTDSMPSLQPETRPSSALSTNASTAVENPEPETTTDNGLLATDQQATPIADNAPPTTVGVDLGTSDSYGSAPTTDDGQLTTDHLVPTSDNGSLATDQNNSSLLTGNSPLIGPSRGRGQRPRLGKVAQLPPDIREWVNLQLLDDVPYDAILDELDDRGHGHITRQNLTNWRSCGGYEQWLSGHMARQERRSHLEIISSYISQCRGRVDEAAMLILSGQLLSLVSDYDPNSFRKHLDADPKAYLYLIQAVARLGKVRQASSKIASASLAGKASGNESDLNILPDAERGLTEETLKKITDAIRLF